MATRLNMPQTGGWKQHFFYRKESLKTTWRFRLALLTLGGLLIAMTSEFWTSMVGESLICTEQRSASDVILVENFDPTYIVFERAAALHKAGLAPRVLVPTDAGPDSGKANLMSQGITELMAQVARLPKPEILPIHITEPISLNAAYQIRDFLTREQLRSVIVVTEGFRSQRTSLIYHSVLDPVGIHVGCVPVFGPTTAQTWPQTWHGIQQVLQQFLKLQYYRFYVLWNRSA